jgi:hypothetical protein
LDASADQGKPTVDRSSGVPSYKNKKGGSINPFEEGIGRIDQDLPAKCEQILAPDR